MVTFKNKLQTQTEEQHAMMTGGHTLSNNMEQLKRNREAAGKDDSIVVVSSGNTAFDAKLNDGFAVMVEALQRKKKSEQPHRKTISTKTNEELTSTTVASAEKTIAPDPASKPSPTVVSLALVTTPGVANDPRSSATRTPPTTTVINPYTTSALSATKRLMPFSTAAPMPQAIDVDDKAMNSSEPYGLREYNSRREHHDQFQPREYHHKLASPQQAKGPAKLAIAVGPATHANGNHHPSPSVHPTTAHLPLLAVVEDDAMGSKEHIIASRLASNTPAPKGPMRNFARKKIPAAPSVVGGTAKGDSIIGPWTCSQCTFYNTNNKWSRAKCEVCYFVRGAKSTSYTGTATETDGVISMD